MSAALETGGLAVAETAFAASRGLFEQVATDLTSPDAAALTHEELCSAQGAVPSLCGFVHENGFWLAFRDARAA
ncbi:hypothetical protein ACFV8T_40875 [Streptomyces sp. NPDC059832]|uniref:hypothetical protein n=1 Tax=unclassified Streptomyces TaxID=2593676 RepID=UPI003646F876